MRSEQPVSNRLGNLLQRVQTQRMTGSFIRIAEPMRRKLTLRRAQELRGGLVSLVYGVDLESVQDETRPVR